MDDSVNFYTMGDCMKDKNIRKCRILKNFVDIIITVVSVLIAEAITDRYLSGTFIWTVMIMAVFIAIFTPLGIFVKSIIETHYNKKEHETKI